MITTGDILKRQDSNPYRNAMLGWTSRFCLVLLLVSSFPVRAQVNPSLVRATSLTVPTQGKTGFTLVNPLDLGITFTNRLTDQRIGQSQNTMNGSGLAAADFDQDGFCDLFFCNKEGPSALYRNLGNGSFSNVTEHAGLALPQQLSVGAIFADLNGDGYPDLYVSSFGGPNALMINQRNGTFKDTTQEAGLVGKSGSTSIACADLDGDGDLDLYLCNFGIASILRDGGEIATRMVNGKPVVSGRYASRLKIIDGFFVEFGDPDTLYWNDGQGRFTPAAWPEFFQDESGKPMQPPMDFGLAVQIRDINNDGFPDIFVCNDFQTPDRIWLNDGKGHFKALPLLAMRNMSYASMGVDFADIDRDGHLDFITVEMLSRDHSHHLQQSSPMRPLNRIPGPAHAREDMPRNNLFWNRGDGTYAEIAQFAGVAATDWSWAPIFIDVDLDGFEDLLVSNGHMHDVNMRDVAESSQTDNSRSIQETKSKLLNYPRLNSPKYAFHNLRNLQFKETSDEWNFNSRAIAHGMCLIDLDQDGDQDVIMNAVNQGPVIYRNETIAPRIQVRLKGLPPNRDGIGAVITLRGASLPTQSQEILAGGRYLASDEPARTFAAGNISNRFELEVKWRSGHLTVIPKVEPNKSYEITEPTPSTATPSQPAPTPPPLFTHTSLDLATHHEQAFDDFAAQPLLPRRFSQLGPGIVCTDLDGDGHEDLVLGSGLGGPLRVLLGNGKGNFDPSSAIPGMLPDDSAGLAAVRLQPNKTVLFTAIAQFEATSPQRPSVHSFVFEARNASVGPTLPSLPSGASPGPIALADYDGDGDLDLFVGGRLIAGRYPEAAQSVLFRNDNNQWVIDQDATSVLKSIGLAVGALWTDLNNDGLPELIVTSDWGPIHVFAHQKGKWSETTESWKLNTRSGWWTGINAIDANGDGRMDLVVGNWGMNGREQNWGRLPYRMYCGDFANDGGLHLVEAIEDSRLSKVVPSRDFALLRTSLPALRASIPTHTAYSQMSVAEILGPEFQKAREFQVNTLHSLLLINQGDHFDTFALPTEAQIAPVYGISIADADGDGHEDVFLAQNCFALRGEDSRMDAGRGLWLRGNGRGEFFPMPGQESGIATYGEQRGCALGDFNEDGRIDLAVTQNGGPIDLYLNQRARPGIMIRLKGPPGNSMGIGAVLRLKSGGHWGPAREIHAGAGYWSQDSSNTLLAPTGKPEEIQVVWPGGLKTQIPIPAQSTTLTVSAPAVSQ